MTGRGDALNWTPDISPIATLPFLRWPGGKRWLPHRLVALLSGLQFRHYYEPFLGGGAVYFALQPPQSTLSDINLELINVYRQVRNSATRIEKKLRQFPVDASTYAGIRDAAPKALIDRAVRFLYLNRTAFAGIYRTNREGRFNVPFGGIERRPDTLWTRELLRDGARALRNAKLLACDFEQQLDAADDGDLVYCDPAYSVTHNDNGFVRYNERVFSWSDQSRLCAASRRAATRGATVVVTNADHSELHDLYRNALAVPICRVSRLSPTVRYRRLTSECIYMIAPTKVKRVIAATAASVNLGVSHGVRRLNLERTISRSHTVGWVGEGVAPSDRR